MNHSSHNIPILSKLSPISRRERSLNHVVAERKPVEFLDARALCTLRAKPLATRKAAVFGRLYSRSMKRVPSALNGTVERAAQFVYGARSAMRQMGMGAKNGA